jgi:hypothetical protein
MTELDKSDQVQQYAAELSKKVMARIHWLIERLLAERSLQDQKGLEEGGLLALGIAVAMKSILISIR